MWSTKSISIKINLKTDQKVVYLLIEKMLCHALAFHPWHKIYNCEIKDVDMKCHRLRRGTALCAVLEQLHCFQDFLLKTRGQRNIFY